jgi:hypothetical protein
MRVAKINDQRAARREVEENILSTLLCLLQSARREMATYKLFSAGAGASWGPGCKLVAADAVICNKESCTPPSNIHCSNECGT